MTRISISLLWVSLVACGPQGDEPQPINCGNVSAGASLAVPPLGTASGSVQGAFSAPLSGRASAYQQGNATAAFTIVSAFTVDAQNRPVGELFILFRSAAKVTDVPLVPVTLEQINDPQFVPSGAFAVYAEAYDATVGDYTRWLLAKSGCARIYDATAETAPNSATVLTKFEGEWRSHAGALLGEGRGSAVLSAHLLDFRTGVNAPLDTMRASVTGVRAKPFTATSLDAFQVLHPGQTRLVIVGTQAADTTRELWLSLSGVPQRGDSVALGPVTFAEARATRTNPVRSFGMLRMIEFQGTQPVVREIWSSTAGWVKFDKVVQSGPLALCGSASGRFEFPATGVSVASPAVSLGTSDVVSGTFKSRFTIVAQSDTLVDPATAPSPRVRRTFRPAAPTSTMGFGCQ